MHAPSKDSKSQMSVLPPLRTTEGIQVPDLSGLRLRFSKQAEEQLTLSIGIFSLDLVIVVGSTIVRKGENVIISDPNFWVYMTEDTALFQWDPPTPSHIDKDDMLLSISVSGRKDEVEICAICASGMPELDMGRSFKVYQSLDNQKGCDAYPPMRENDFMDSQVSKAVVVDRGECTFLHKVRTAKKAGFDLVIVVDWGLMAGQRFIPSLLTEKDTAVPVEELISLVLVTGRRDVGLIRRAEKIRIAGVKKHERRMVVRGGCFLFIVAYPRICLKCPCQTVIKRIQNRKIMVRFASLLVWYKCIRKLLP
jgi:hypothetical protein